MKRLKRLRASNTWLIVAAAAIFLLVGSLVSTKFAFFTVNGFGGGMVYGSLALALVLIYRATHVINFAQGELAMFTTFVAWDLITHHGFSYWPAFFTTLAIAFVIGVVLQVAVIRPVQHRSVVATVIVTIGLFILIDGIVAWKWSSEPFMFLPPPVAIGTWNVGGVLIQHYIVAMVGVILASLAAVWALFRFTKLGLAMRAAALRPAAASLVGVRVDVMLAIGWGLAAVLGAVAGLMAMPPAFNILEPTFMLNPLVFAFAGAALGGLESPVGAMIGGVAIGIFQSLIVGFVPQISSQLQLPFTFLILLGILLIKPSGLFGRREVQRV